MMKKSVAKMLLIALIALFINTSFPSVEAAERITSDSVSSSTLNRVCDEILTGEITKIEDIFCVASAYMDAGLLQSGITASINKDGRLQIMQLIDLKTANLQSIHEKSDVAVSVLLVLNPDGTEASGTQYLQDSGGLNEYSVFAVHTAYFDMRENSFFDPIEVRMTTISTRLIYGTQMTASRLVHSYSAEQNRLDDSQESRTFASVNSPVQGRDYTNSVYSSWYSVGKGLQGYLSSKAVISVGTTSFTLSTYNNLDSFL